MIGLHHFSVSPRIISWRIAVPVFWVRVSAEEVAQQRGWRPKRSFGFLLPRRLHLPELNSKRPGALTIRKRGRRFVVLGDNEPSEMLRTRRQQALNVVM